MQEHRFEERYDLTKPPGKWFEARRDAFDRKDEESVRRASRWLTEPPEHRADLVEG